MKLILPQTPEEKLITDIQKAKKDIEESKSSQPPTVNLSAISSLDFTIGSMSTYNITCTLSNVDDKRIIAIPEIAFFKDQVISAANLYPGGANWTASAVSLFEVECFYDWGLTDNANMKYAVNLYNGGITDIDIKFVVRWRYLTPQAS